MDFHGLRPRIDAFGLMQMFPKPAPYRSKAGNSTEQALRHASLVRMSKTV